MKEREFTLRVWEAITPVRHPALFRIMIDGLTCTLPEHHRARFAGRVWGWGARGSLAPDLLVADEGDKALAVFEFKSREAHANAARRSTYRKTAKADDPVAQRIAARWLDSDAALDADHHESVCIAQGQECEWRKPVSGKLGWHYPAVSQADVYRSTVRYFHPDMTVGDLSELLFVLVSPHDRSTRGFFESTVAQQGTEWQVVPLREVLRYWSQHLDTLDGADRDSLAVLINAGRTYLWESDAVPAVS